jgi:hypothetical protein
MPENENLRAIVESIMGELEPSVMAETIERYTKPEGAARPRWTEAERTSLYNYSLELSSLAGLQYYSASRGEMRTFYATSTVIDDPKEKNPKNDPAFSKPPTELTIYARQRDLTFGDNIYKYQYYLFPEAIIFVQENLTIMNKGIIPAVGKNKLRSVVAVLDDGSDLIIYAVSMAKAVSLPGLKERVGNSFSNRAEAILTWFKGQADKAFGG